MFDIPRCPECRKVIGANYRLKHKEQIAARKKDWQQKNKDKILEYERQYRADHAERYREHTRRWHKQNQEKVKRGVQKYIAENAEKLRIKRAQYRINNREKLNARHDAWVAANPERQKALIAEWRKKNPEVTRLYANARRARKEENGGKLSKGLVKKLLQLQRGRCACCFLPLGEKFHLDHRMPLARNGANEDWNMQLLHPRCNSQKKDKHPIDFMQSKGFLL